MNKSQRYPAILFRQRDGAPLQVAFVAPSSDIDSWARVPTKRTGNIRNFQRAAMAKHVKEVETFFTDKHNASPTSVVVGFDPVRSDKAVKVEPADNSEIAPGAPVSGSLSIEWLVDPDPQGRPEIIAQIVEWRPRLEAFVLEELRDITSMSQDALVALAKRIADGFRAGELREIDVDESGSDAESEEADSDDAETADLDDSPLPADIREALAGLSPGERSVILGRLWFLGQLDRDLLLAWGEDRLQQLYREVYDEMKPGILIDGQHRVMGTRRLPNVAFLVTALPAADWSELAFQFIVTNGTAKRVPESLLISIVGNSLSKRQRADIETRLRDANIRVGLIEAVMMIHENEDSPFHGLLAFGLKKESGFLDAAAMQRKVVKLWYERQSPVRELFDHLCKGRLMSERTDYWKSEALWYEFFRAFWSTVETRYEGSDVFSSELKDKTKKTPASRLMTATALMIFQETLLESLLKYFKDRETTEGSPIATAIPNADAFTTLVSNKLEKLTPEFFQGWELTGFDGSKGARDDLAEAIQLVVSGGATVSKLKDDSKGKAHRLFKKTSIPKRS